MDTALKAVGVGSVGTHCYIALLAGRDDDDPLFLQLKQAEASVLEAHLPKSTYRHHGQRVVAGQRLMQASSDIFLGWTHSLTGRDYYVRHLRARSPALRRFLPLCPAAPATPTLHLQLAHRRAAAVIFLWGR